MSSLSPTLWWGNANAGITWSAAYSPSSTTYPTAAADDAGGPGFTVAIGYAGRNWARPNGQVGSGIFTGNYGSKGYMPVRFC